MLGELTQKREAMMHNECEYQSLRQEILELFQREYQSVTVGLTATGAILGYGLSQDSTVSLFFLIPLVILSLVLMQLKQCHDSILQIAVYIRMRYEKDKKNELGFYWESYMYRQRELSSEIRDYNPVTSFTMINYFVLASILSGALCIVIAVIYAFVGSDKHFTYSIAFCVISSIFWCILSFVIFNKMTNRSLWDREKRLEKDLTKLVEPDIGVSS